MIKRIFGRMGKISAIIVLEGWAKSLPLYFWKDGQNLCHYIFGRMNKNLCHYSFGRMGKISAIIIIVRAHLSLDQTLAKGIVVASRV